jgi:Mn2+/Fe2+ NRAMP family transporter
MNLVSTTFYTYRKIWKFLKTFFIIVGPGIIVLVADNDAGGITTYAVTGSLYGYNLIWVIIFLFPMVYFIQEMTVRLGAVTKKGLAEAIFDGFGKKWGWFALINLLVVNWLTLITEFIGMSVAARTFHIPPFVTIIIMVMFLTGIVLSGRYWTFEKITLLFCALNFVYIPAALAARPDWNEVFSSIHSPQMHISISVIMIIMANLGTTITPWQLYFQQSAVVDKGLDEKDIRFGKLDTLVGALFTCLVPIFIMVTTGSTLFKSGVQISEATDAARSIVPFAGNFAGALFSIGLFDAGFLGAICVSLSSTWAFGEVFGWAHSLNKKVREAPWFYLFYILLLSSSGAVVLIPDAPHVLITIMIQVITIIVLPITLIFQILLLNDKDTMGEFKNTIWENLANWGIVIIVILLSTFFGLTNIFPNLLM